MTPELVYLRTPGKNIQKKWWPLVSITRKLVDLYIVDFIGESAPNIAVPCKSISVQDITTKTVLSH